jgi:hypothetical protein
MSEASGAKPKIIVDDDWKERVQAEKEAMQRNPPNEERRGKQAESLPSASFSLLVTSLASQALVALGQAPDASGKAAVQLEHARHVVDMLTMLEEKTRGNLSKEEATLLARVLHELRMIFVAVSRRPAGAGEVQGAASEKSAP